MKQTFEISRDKVTMALLMIRQVKAPNAWVLGKVEKWLTSYLDKYGAKVFRVTIESEDEPKNIAGYVPDPAVQAGHD